MKNRKKAVFVTRKAWLLLAASFLALASSLLAGTSLQAHAASNQGKLTYYGADLHAMELATGIHLDGSITPNGPWPQYTDNYCFVSVVQALVNYMDLTTGRPMRYPTQSDQGPASKNPDDEQPGQILYDMDHYMIPPQGPLTPQGSGVSRRPYTLANIAYDFGGDPRSQSFGVDFESRGELNYHEHIYHNGAVAATLGLAQALALYQQPVIALVNHAEHSVIVAGVWATGNPLTDPDVQIKSLAIFNPWNESWGIYLSQKNYAQVSYEDWIGTTSLPAPWGGTNSWLSLPYSVNGNLDPDPSIGLYQAGAGTRNPDAHHWVGNFVIIQPDSHPQSANFTFDENNHLMLQP